MSLCGLCALPTRGRRPHCVARPATQAAHGPAHRLQCCRGQQHLGAGRGPTYLHDNCLRPQHAPRAPPGRPPHGRARPPTQCPAFWLAPPGARSPLSPISPAAAPILLAKPIAATWGANRAAWLDANLSMALSQSGCLSKLAHFATCLQAHSISHSPANYSTRGPWLAARAPPGRAGRRARSPRASAPGGPPQVPGGARRRGQGRAAPRPAPLRDTRPGAGPLITGACDWRV